MSPRPSLSDVSPNFTQANPSSLPNPNIIPATPPMCIYAFDLLLYSLHSNTPAKSSSMSSFASSFSSSASKRPYPSQYLIPNPSEAGLFITWSILAQKPTRNSRPTRSAATADEEDSTAYMLRGCIGTLNPAPLHDTLSKYPCIAAFNDSRFDPITVTELERLKCAVSVLSGFETAPNGVYDWIVGVHGIVLTFSYPVGGEGQDGHGNGNSRDNNSKGQTQKTRSWISKRTSVSSTRVEHYSATYLPEVAAEMNWTKEKCIETLVRKAGFHGEITPQLLNNAKLQRYVTSKVHMTYQQYLQWKEQYHP